LRWMAPECIKDHVYGYKTDVWSFGITLIEIFTRKPPYPDISDPLSVAARLVAGGLLPAIPSNASDTEAEVIKDCLNMSSVDRPDFAEICSRLESSNSDMR